MAKLFKCICNNDNFKVIEIVKLTPQTKEYRRLKCEKCGRVFIDNGNMILFDM